MTVVAVGHDLAQAKRHATHVALVSGGQVRVGTTAERFTAEDLRTTFGREVWP